MEILIIMAVVSGVVGLIVKAVKEHTRQVEETWSGAAMQLGMRFSPGAFMKSKSIHGRLYDNRVEVDTFKKSSGQSSTTFTRYKIYYPETLGLGLHLKQQGFAAGVAAFFGAQDIDVGDPIFDSQVVVKSTRPERVLEFLTPSRRSRILRLFKDYPECEITDHVIEWSKKGNEKQAEQIVTTVRRLAFDATRLRDSLETPEDPSSPEPEPSVPLSEYESPVPVSVPEPIAPDPEPVVPEPEPEPAPIVPEPQPEPVKAVPEPEPEVVEPPPVAATSNLDVALVCEELFAIDVASSETRRLFDERYKNELVRWSGELRQVASYHIDMVFKGDPGTRIVLQVHDGVGGAFGRRVQAIVQLPQDALAQLNSRIGSRVTVEGRLLSCDALTRNLYVAEGKLV